MNKRNMFISAIGVLTIVVGLSACSSTKNGLSNESTQTDIRWLTDNLQKKGVFISERGFADLNIPAATSARLILNSREILDVYGFERRTTAEAKAYEFANRLPRQDVFLKESLVVVRHSKRDNGLSLTLHNLLGKAL